LSVPHLFVRGHVLCRQHRGIWIPAAPLRQSSRDGCPSTAEVRDELDEDLGFSAGNHIQAGNFSWSQPWAYQQRYKNFGERGVNEPRRPRADLPKVPVEPKTVDKI
jgi:hypothetical protein